MKSRKSAKRSRKSDSYYYVGGTLDNRFIIKRGDLAEFYWCKYSGAYVHLSLLIKSQTGAEISIGFYPKNGAMMGSITQSKDGQIWSPDPLFKKGSPKPALDYNNGNHIVYTLTIDQAFKLNNILSRCIENTQKGRLECNVPEMYNMLSFRNGQTELNCISWLTNMFKDLEYNLYGDSILHKVKKTTAGVASTLVRRV
jgi:hypothetical protein